MTNDIEELSRVFSSDSGKEIIWGDISTKDCSCVSVYKKENGNYGILIVFYRRSGYTISNITHEAIHAADFIWEYLGENSTGAEANAYLAGWIAQCIEEAKNYKDG